MPSRPFPVEWAGIDNLTGDVVIPDATDAQAVLLQQNVPSQAIWAVAWRRLRRSPLVMICLAVIVVYVAVTIAVALGWHATDWRHVVGERYQAPTRQTPFGTDIHGQSVWRKTVYGAKTSLTVAFVASAISIGIGLPLGAIAGYFGRRIDDLIVWLYSTIESIPHILLILAFAVVLRGQLEGLSAVYLAIGLTSWVGLCRLIRGEVIKHRQRDYVTAAKAFGGSDLYIIFRHIVPNVFHLVIIDFSLRFVGFIHVEVILSFLGLGVKDEPSWGQMINDARNELSHVPMVWWQLTAATFAILIISLALNIFGDALRDALDPKLKGR